MLAATLLIAAAVQLPPLQSDAVIGVVGVHLQSGRRIEVRGAERFPMGSVYKFPIVLAALHLVDLGALKLDQEVVIEPKNFSPGWSPLRDKAAGKPVGLSVRELLRYTVEVSDNSASDRTLELIGGPSVVAERLKELGFGGIRIDRSERTIAQHLDAEDGFTFYAKDERDTSTPAEMAALLTAFRNRRDGLSRASHDLLVQWMTETRTGARRIKSVMPAGSIVTHKTGTMPGTVNDAAIVTSPDGKHDVVLVIFTKAGTSPEKVREDDVAAVARMVWKELVGDPQVSDARSEPR